MTASDRPQRVALLGATGQLGADLVQAFAHDPLHWQVSALGPADGDVRDYVAMREVLGRLTPDVVLNTTAYNRVDDAESDAAAAFAVNTVAVHQLARICRELGSKLVHVSTDFVFGGDTGRQEPYREGDPPAPQSVYASSKVAGEHVVRTSGVPHLIVRTSGLYGGTATGRGDMSNNFVLTMLALADAGKAIKVVEDQRLTPTATRDLATKMIEVRQAGAAGLLHLTAAGECSWLTFAREIFRLAGLAPQLTATTSAAWAAPASRPAYSVLTSEVLPRLGIAPLRPWQEALADYLRALGRLKS